LNVLETVYHQHGKSPINTDNLFRFKEELKGHLIHVPMYNNWVDCLPLPTHPDVLVRLATTFPQHRGFLNHLIERGVYKPTMISTFAKSTASSTTSNDRITDAKPSFNDVEVKGMLLEPLLLAAVCGVIDTFKETYELLFSHDHNDRMDAHLTELDDHQIEEVIKSAVKSGNFELVKYIHNMPDFRGRSTRNFILSTEAVEIAAENGDFEMIQYIHQQYEQYLSFHHQAQQRDQDSNNEDSMNPGNASDLEEIDWSDIPDLVVTSFPQSGPLVNNPESQTRLKLLNYLLVNNLGNLTEVGLDHIVSTKNIEALNIVLDHLRTHVETLQPKTMEAPSILLPQLANTPAFQNSFELLYTLSQSLTFLAPLIVTHLSLTQIKYWVESFPSFFGPYEYFLAKRHERFEVVKFLDSLQSEEHERYWEDLGEGEMAEFEDKFQSEYKAML
jgi:hypothetical protein